MKRSNRKIPECGKSPAKQAKTTVRNHKRRFVQLLDDAVLGVKKK